MSAKGAHGLGPCRTCLVTARLTDGQIAEYCTRRGYGAERRPAAMVTTGCADTDPSALFGFHPDPLQLHLILRKQGGADIRAHRPNDGLVVKRDMADLGIVDLMRSAD